MAEGFASLPGLPSLEDTQGGSPLTRQRRQIAALEQSAREAGLEDELLEPRENLLLSALNVIDMPKQAIQGIIDSAFIRQDIFEPDVGLGIERAWEERANAWDLLRRETDLPAWARAATGLGLEIVTDPLSWIHPLSKGAAIGGRSVLTKAGESRLAGLTDQLYKGGYAPTRTSAALKADDIFERLTTIQELERKRKAKPKWMSGTELEADLRSVDAQIAKERQAILAHDVNKSSQDPFELTLDSLSRETNDLFSGPGLKFEIGLPFVGHFAGHSQDIPKALSSTGAQKTATDALKRGPLGRAFDSLLRKPAAAVFKPGTIKAGQVELPESARVLMEGYKIAAGNLISKADDVLKAAKEIPGLGTPAALVEGAAKLSSGLAKVAANIFARKLVLGERVYNATRERQHMLAGANSYALDTVQKYVPDFTEKLMDAKQRGLAPGEMHKVFQEDMEASLILDELAKNFIALPEAENLLEEISKIRMGAEIDSKRLQKLFGTALPAEVERMFDSQVDELLSAMDFSEGGKQRAKALLEAFDAIRKEEIALGIGNDTHFLAFYLPHRYLDPKHYGVEKLAGKAKAPKPGFLHKQKYKSLEDALNDRGYVPEINSAMLLWKRANESWVARANKRYFDRRVLIDGLDKTTLRSLAIEAVQDGPESPAWKLLVRDGFISEGIMEHEALADLKKTLDSMSGDDAVLGRMTKAASAGGKQLTTKAKDRMERQLRMALEQGPDSKIYKRLQRQGFLDEKNLPKVSDAYWKEQTAKAALQDGVLNNNEYLRALHEFEGVLDTDFFVRNQRPQDTALFSAIRGELGQEYKVGGKSFFMPQPVRDAIDETLAQRDLLKDHISRMPRHLGEPLGNLLELYDRATDSFKYWSTRVWPGYWGQNILGDRSFGVAEGIANIDPGALLELQNLKMGRTAAKFPAVGIMNQKDWDEIIKTFGVGISAPEMMELAGSHGRSLEEWMRKQTPLKAKDFAEAPVKAALTAARKTQDLMQERFENIYREVFLYNSLKNGSSVPEAIRQTGDALIDYRDLSAFEQSYLRRFFFFSTWLTKSTKKTLLSYFTSPNDLQVQMRQARSLAEFFSADNAPPTIEEREFEEMRTKAATEQVSFALGENEQGDPIIGRGFGLPLNTVLQLFSLQKPRDGTIVEMFSSLDDSVTRSMQKAFASSNPILNNIAQKVMNKNLYFDKPLNSKFLRKVPALAEAAEKLAPYAFDKIPADVLDGPTRFFLQAVPDGEGNYIADPGLYWLVVNWFPGLNRAISTGRAVLNEDVPGPTRALRFLTGVRLDTADPETTLGYERIKTLRDLMINRSVNELKKQGG